MNKKRKMMNKRGLELEINTLVIIILSVLVLIALLLIWNYQTGVFSDFLKNIQGKTNVDGIVTACNILASQQAVYEFCCIARETKYENSEGKIQEEKLTCLGLANKNFTGGRIQSLDCENVGC